MRILVSTMVAIAVLSTAFVSVRLHHEVAALRYRLFDLEEQRDRADRELRLAVAEYEEAKSPRRLLERWSELRGAADPVPERAPAMPAPAEALAPAGPTEEAPPDAPLEDAR